MTSFLNQTEESSEGDLDLMTKFQSYCKNEMGKYKIMKEILHQTDSIKISRGKSMTRIFLSRLLNYKI